MSEAGRWSRVFLGDRPRARYAAVIAGYAALALALTLAIAHAWLPSAVCAVPALALLWRTGAVATPRGADAYLRRVAEALRMWAVEIEAAFDQAGRRSRTWASPLRRLRPPPGREALHARVLALGRRGAADEGTAAWAKRAAARFAEIEAIRRELAGARVSDAERRYAIAVDDVLSDRLYSYDEAVGQAEAAIARARRRLERARPPRAAARAHADVVDAFVAEGVAYRTMLAACRDGDPAAARAAAERADAAGAAVERAWAVLLDALGGELRRPAARTTDEASRS